ncbi:MAG: spore germination protein [Thermoflexaceae bacterium]|nr:spore germination protein [Thermoflexaceae bacterium]
MEKFTTSLQDNVSGLQKILRLDKNFDLIYKDMKIDGVDAGFFFIDGFIEDGIMQRILQYFYGLKKEDLRNADFFASAGLPYVEVDVETDVDMVVTNILSGVAAFFVDGFDQCVMIDCRTYPMRSVDEPWKDKVLRGSRDGFVETLVFNAALMRRRIRDPKFSVEIMRVGERSRSDVALCYIEDKADPRLVKSLKDKLSHLKVEALTMNVESIAECLLPGKWINPFPKFKYSERPDTAAAAVFDGNVVLMVDNSPAVIILPTSLFDMLEEADDFYFPPLVGCYLRFSRFLITILAVFLTPVWMLLLNNPEWVPGWLEFILISDNITVPVIFQLLILEIAIDGLKMAAVSTPNALSTPLSVVAGIIVGEYAISSGWFNAESMLYMAFITIATYSQASFEMGYALKFCRVMILILTEIFSLWGFVAGTAITVMMVVCNRTLSGKSYIYPLIPFNADKLKRKLLRIRLPHEYD